jgi:hypothetical protein
MLDPRERIQHRAKTTKGAASRQGRNALLTALGVLVALIVVAIASRGSIPAGEGGARAPKQALIDIVFTLYLLTIASSAVLAIYLLVLRRQLEARGEVQRRSKLERLLVLLVFLGIASLGVRRLSGLNPINPPNVVEGADPGGSFPGATSSNSDAAQAGFSWGAAGVTTALILLALGAWWYAGRARKRARGELRGPEDRLATELAAAMDESLWDLRAEPDPRRAVIAAYARLERVLAAHRLPRRPAEAPLEYLARMLNDLSVSPEAARRLTDLFERAKFSQHAVRTEMKEEAIEALETVRDDLLAARALAEQEEKAAIAARREKPA